MAPTLLLAGFVVFPVIILFSFSSYGLCPFLMLAHSVWYCTEPDPDMTVARSDLQRIISIRSLTSASHRQQFLACFAIIYLQIGTSPECQGSRFNRAIT